MILHLHLPNHDEALAFNRQRWVEVLEDPKWNDYPGKIETNAFGQIVMTPPADFAHGRRQFQIAKALEKELGGRSLTGCPIVTADGVKAADAAWFSEERYRQVAGQRAVEIAPEICVEVLSPRNSDAEMQVKRELYFEAGAIECWICDSGGHMTYYDHNAPNTPIPQSKLSPNFPIMIND